jgi:hypothetical protein
MDWIELIKELNWQTIIGMFVIVWYFTRDIKQNIEKIHQDLQHQGERTDKLYEMFVNRQTEFHKEIMDLRKETDQRFREIDQKFYDLLKEQKGIK